jgi:hypothetical protein
MSIDSLGPLSSAYAATELIEALPERIRKAHQEASVDPVDPAPPQPTESSETLRACTALVEGVLTGDVDEHRLIDEILGVVLSPHLDALGATEDPMLKTHICEVARTDPTILAEIDEILREIARSLASIVADNP